MSDPRWMTDCDEACASTTRWPRKTSEWLTFLISRLPPQARDFVAYEWRHGKYPDEVNQKTFTHLYHEHEMTEAKREDHR